MEAMMVHNTMLSMVKDVHESYKNLITEVCKELGQPEKAAELQEKYLNSNLLKVKKMKDPNAPKKAKTGFMFFCDEMRPKVMKKNPEAKMGAVAKILGEKWRALDAKAKEKYDKLHEDDQERYKSEMDNY
jgi:structure-specific recognition protein 1